MRTARHRYRELSDLMARRPVSPRVQPDLDQIRRWPNKEQRENRSVDNLIQPQKKLASATQNATTHWPMRDRTVVFGSVIMKKTKS